MIKVRLLCIILICCLPASAWAVKVRLPDSFTLASPRTHVTLDPAFVQDSVSRQRILNIYETLIFFDGPHTDQFIPVLALEVPSLNNGGISPDGKSYIFNIRKGVKYHHGNELTPEDVVYSLKRNIFEDPRSQIHAALLEALTGKRSLFDENGNFIQDMVEAVNDCFSIIGKTLVIQLPRPYPPLLGILSGVSGVIVNKGWAVAQGCWNGEAEGIGNRRQIMPGKEPLQKIASGTNAFRLKNQVPSQDCVLERFDDYWGELPAITTAIFKHIPSWYERKKMFDLRTADRIIFEAGYLSEMLQTQGADLIKTPLLSISCAFFCRRVRAVDNPHIGSGKLDGNGIPPDFLEDINVRKAFLHAFDSDTYQTQILQDMAIIPSTPIVQGTEFHRKTPVYQYDLEKSAHYMKQAWNGQVWEKGFKMIMAYNTGNELRKAAAYLLAENIMSLNPKFQLTIIQTDWNTFRDERRRFSYPIFFSGWNAEYPDPHHLVDTFMDSGGFFPQLTAYQNPLADTLIKQGIFANDPLERETIYHALQTLWFEDAVGLTLYQPVSMRVYQNYIQYPQPNPLFDEEWENLKTIKLVLY